MDPSADVAPVTPATAPAVTWSARDYWDAAVTPRMIGIFVLLLAAALVSVRLGAWQLDRAAVRGAAEAEAAHAALLASDPVPLEDVLRAQTTFTADHLARPVSVAGTFEPKQVLVPNRSVEGQDAVLVVTALRVAEGPDAGAMIPVLRGWVPAGDVTIGEEWAPADEATAALLAVPEGERTVTGHLGASEAGVANDLPAGMVTAISAAELAGLWGGPTYGGYLVESRPTGADGLRAASPPEMAQETGLNIQNLAYAVEWVIFGGFALFLWGRMVRDEVLHRREDAAAAASPPAG